MASFKKSLSALAVVATIAGGAGAAAFAISPALAQPAQNQAQQPGWQHHGWNHHGWQHHGHHAMNPTLMLNGRLAFLKTVLQITPAQEPDFDKFADALRANVTERISTWKEMRQNHAKGQMTAVDRLTNLAQLSQTRAQETARVLAAFKPLYQELSPDQQKMANRLATMVMMHRRAHHGEHGGHGHPGGRG